MTMACATVTSRCRSPPTIIVVITSKPACGCTSTPMAPWRCFMAHAVSPATPLKARQCKQTRGARHDDKSDLNAASTSEGDAITPAAPTEGAYNGLRAIGSACSTPTHHLNLERTTHETRIARTRHMTCYINRST